MERGDGGHGVYVLPVPSTTAIESSPEPVDDDAARDRGAVEPPPPSRVAGAAPETRPPSRGRPSRPPSRRGETATADPASRPRPRAPTRPSRPPRRPSRPPTRAAQHRRADQPSPTRPTRRAPSTEPSTAPTPSVEVTPRPDGAVEIASNVIVVGTTAAYSPDGTHFAFTARPADGDAGPDVYVWKVGDKRALAVTDDHRSVFAGWLGKRLLISRVARRRGADRGA